MILKEYAKQVDAEIRKLCDADDFTFHIGESETLETRFAQNRITQHMGKVHLTGYISVVYDNKKGSVQTNDFSLERLPDLLKRAKDMALLTQPDQEYIPTQPKTKLIARKNCYDSVINLTNEEMVDIVAVCIKRAEKEDAQISGMTEKEIERYYTSGKNGFEDYQEYASFGHSMTMKRGNSETKLAISVLRMEQFNLEAELEQIVSQLNDLTEPKDMDAKTLPVILRPQAVANFFGWLTWMMDRRQADEGFTPYTGQVGTQFFGEKFNLYSTDQVEGLMTPSSIGEMAPFKSTSYIKDGVIENMPVSRYWAQKQNIEYVTYPANYIIAGDGVTEEEMMKMVPEGLIINNFWYLRMIDGKKGEITGMTRDGVLYFKDGKIQYAVNNFRFNEIPHDATRRILALGKEEQRDVNTILPTMLINDFCFVDKSTF